VDAGAPPRRPHIGLGRLSLVSRIAPVAGLALVVAVLIAGCSSPYPTTQGGDPDLGEITCDAWAELDADNRETVADSFQPSANVTLTDEYTVDTSSGSPQVRLLDGSLLSGSEEILDWACEASDGDVALAESFDETTSLTAPDCAEFLAADDDVRALWRSTLETSSGQSGPAFTDDLDRVCGAFEDQDVVGAASALDALLAELRARGFQWSGGPVEMSNREGYTSTVSFSGELFGYSADPTQARPGYTIITFSLTVSAQFANTTPQRENSAFFGVSVSPVFPGTSEMCSLRTGNNRDGWAWLSPEFEWNTGVYCIPWIDPINLGPGTLGPGASGSDTETVTYEHEVPETAIPEIERYLNDEGTTKWIAYVNSLNVSANDGAMSMSTECSVFNGAFNYPVIAVSESIDTEGCVLAIAPVAY
jgi:hypothetical protein